MKKDKGKWKLAPKKDIMGNLLINYPKMPKKFVLLPPPSGLRYVKNYENILFKKK